MSGITEIIEITNAIITLAPIIENAVVQTEPAINTIENVLTEEIQQMIKNIHVMVLTIKESLQK